MHRPLIFALTLGFLAPVPSQAQKVGDAVPSFSLTGLDGRTYTPASYDGSVFVLYYLGHN